MLSDRLRPLLALCFVLRLHRAGNVPTYVQAPAGAALCRPGAPPLAPAATLSAGPSAFLPLALPLRGGMTIKVKTLTGREFEIDIEPSDTVQRIKERLEEKEGIAPDQQRLIFSGTHAPSVCR